jgi:hypothetical protein
MPARGECSAPFFDDTQPEELSKYFADLQFLLNSFQVVNENKRKQATIKYLKIWTESLWKTTPVWLDPAATFDAFKAEVYRLYPDMMSNQTWSCWSLSHGTLFFGHVSNMLI